MEIVVNISWVFLTNRSLNINGFSMVFGGPGGVREVREVKRKNCHQFLPKTLRRIASYKKS